MANWGEAGQGAASGAITGGSIGGPWGALAGGALGGIAGLFGKKKKRNKRLSSLDPNQQNINQQQYASFLGEGPLADLYNYDPEQANSVFDQTIANPAYQNFQENIVPTITGQFRSNNLQNSSYSGGALGKAGADVQRGLDAQRAQYLYGQEQGAQTAKRSGIENFQNRQNFAYDNAAPQGFDINQILSSISPEVLSGLQGHFGKKPVAGVK